MKVVEPALQTETCKEAIPPEDFPCGPNLPFCVAKNDRLLDEEGTEAPAKLKDVIRACRRSEINGGGSCNFSVSLSELEFCGIPTPTPTPPSESGTPCEVDCRATYGPLYSCVDGLCEPHSPVLVDVAGDGFALTDAAGGVE